MYVCTKKAITYLGMRMNERLTWGDHIKYRLQIGDMRLAKARNLCKKKRIRRKYARMVVWNTAIAAATYGAEIWWEGKKKGIEEKYNVIFKKYARAITGLPRGSEGNMVMLKSGIQTVISALDKRKRRFAVRLLATETIDNRSERDKTE